MCVCVWEGMGVGGRKGNSEEAAGLVRRRAALQM